MFPSYYGVIVLVNIYSKICQNICRYIISYVILVSDCFFKVCRNSCSHKDFINKHCHTMLMGIGINTIIMVTGINTIMMVTGISILLVVAGNSWVLWYKCDEACCQRIWREEKVAGDSLTIDKCTVKIVLTICQSKG